MAPYIILSIVTGPVSSCTISTPCRALCRHVALVLPVVQQLSSLSHQVLIYTWVEWSTWGWSALPDDTALIPQCPSIEKGETWYFSENPTPKKWNESGFRPPLCTYRLNWARRTSWGWWDDWDDTVLQTQDSKFKPWRSETEHATSWSRRLPQYWLSHVDEEETFFVSFKPPRPGTEPRTLAWKAAVLTTTLGPPPILHLASFELTQQAAALANLRALAIAPRPFT